MPYLLIVVVLAFTIFFYRAAEFENESSLVWCGLSVIISVLVLLVFKWGVLGIILGQIGLFAGITIFRVLRKS